MFVNRFLAFVSRACVFLFALLVLGNNLAADKSSVGSLTIRNDRKECTVQPGGSNATDDAVAIRAAFDECGHGGKVVFLNETYYVNSVLNTSGLEDVDIELHGTLLWSTDVDYWLNNSLPMGYQNHTTAWIFGGHGVRFQGFGYGTFDGNGQVWYDFAGSVSNYPHRPHQLTIWETYDSVFEGLRFVQSQMWTMTVKNSENVLLQDIYVNNTSENDSSARNTDGADTIYAKNITFNRWHIVNGDDGIAIKANSSEIYIYDTIFEDGQSLAIGSIGQFLNWYEFIENIYARNITLINTRWAIYLKTWTGVQKGYPPNGGGGGLGYMRNITMESVTHVRTRGLFQITQCTSYNDESGDCDTSRFHIGPGITFRNHTGTTTATEAADLQCSADADGCDGVEISGIDVTIVGSNGTVVDGYECSNVVEPTVGFVCDGEEEDDGD
ncbi:Glycoside hydrolase family 28 [Lasiodiplodia theobromae]|uniref:Alpha-L-rhamnosidase rgxB n=1 Tax=Lasiodiplodia theobromae TaxID=45133 RepID=A0A5N5D676_9PEZI|nr:Glycoside hydrolase family 28 [Lasiodiplodia theobromae]KAB2572844.1 Alpha-L-rhamnosidase rgxB [Lasiodiplodia theobromae]KAF4537532.1 Glycoside hydrolase family 28 [Lasiodiplodia theobromae]